jgi:hypothetical protein
LKTKEEELCALLDIVFESAERPDFAAVRELAFRSQHSSWLITELLKAIWLCADDEAAFDEYIWLMTNGNS